MPIPKVFTLRMNLQLLQNHGILRNSNHLSKSFIKKAGFDSPVRLTA